MASLPPRRPSAEERKGARRRSLSAAGDDFPRQVHLDFEVCIPKYELRTAPGTEFKKFTVCALSPLCVSFELPAECLRKGPVAIGGFNAE